MSRVMQKTSQLDRPGWIPAEITHNWDTDPYAYQTEEELMPGGGLHGQLLAYLMELLRATLKARGLMLLMDTFMLYRDKQGIKQRIAPDLLLMPFRFPPPSAYDLDVEPPPLCVVEVTSTKSHFRDLQQKVPFYLGLGIPFYLPSMRLLHALNYASRLNYTVGGWSTINLVESILPPMAAWRCRRWDYGSERWDSGLCSAMRRPVNYCVIASS